MADPLYDFMLKAYDGSIERFRVDLEQLSHEQLDKCWGQSSRKAYDVVYEVSVMNRRAAVELRGEDAGPFPWKFGEEWLQAPAEYCDTAAAVEFFGSTAGELRDALEARREDPLSNDEGPTDLFKTLRFGAAHTAYHDAQLNMIQAMSGDMTVHW